LRCLDFEKNDFEKNAFKKTGIEKPNEKNSADDYYIFTDDLMFVVHSIAVNYHKPARLDDELIATARIVASGAAQLRFEQRILRGGKELCGGEVKIVCVDRRTMKPRRIPSVLLGALSI
jgi:4-hydroxybenzoyl-CoA thioesterase/acyl-CoA thioester hydrolase